MTYERLIRKKKTKSAIYKSIQTMQKAKDNYIEHCLAQRTHRKFFDSMEYNYVLFKGWWYLPAKLHAY